jgi:hypothetical protein
MFIGTRGHPLSFISGPTENNLRLIPTFVKVIFHKTTEICFDPAVAFSLREACSGSFILRV